MFRLKKKKNYYNTKYIISAVWFCSVFTPIFGFMKKIIYLVQYCKEFNLIIDLNIDICIYIWCMKLLYYFNYVQPLLYNNSCLLIRMNHIILLKILMILHYHFNI
jgi:hypothetical protein